MESTATHVTLGPALPRRQEREQELQRLLADLLTLLREDQGDSLQAILLSGSLARSEATALTLAGGDWLLLSDLDLYVVGSGAMSTALRERLQRRLAQAKFLCAGADVAFVGPGHFNQLGATLPAAQLAHSLRVLWRRSLEWELKPPRVARVEPDDALALLQNRAGELLYVRARAELAQADLLRCYRELRLAMDGVLAFLAVDSGYEPDRAVRETRFSQLLEQSGVSEGLRAGWLSLLQLHRRSLAGELTAAELLARFEPSQPASAHRRFTRLCYAAMLARFFGPAQRPEAALAAAERMSPAQWQRAQARWLRRRGRVGTLREARRWAALAPSACGAWIRYGWGGSGPERVRCACVEQLCGEGDGLSARWAQATFGPTLRRQPLEPALAKLWSEWMLGGRRL